MGKKGKPEKKKKGSKFVKSPNPKNPTPDFRGESSGGKPKPSQNPKAR